MRLLVTLSLFLAVVGSLRADAPPLNGTMPEDYLPGLQPLLKEAVERSPNTISASISLAQAEAGRYSAAASLWPQASLSADYAVARESVTNGVPNTSKGLLYNASLSQSVFQWGAYRNSKIIGDLSAKIAERQFAEAYRTLAVIIREQYLGLIGKKIQMRNAQFALKITQESMAAQQARFEAGAASQADLGNFRMSVDEAQLAADRAADDFAYTKRVFTRLVGIDDLPDDTIPLMVPHPEYSATLADTVLTGFVGEGIESTFQNQVYQMYLKQQDLTYSIAKVRLLPKVNAAAGYGYSYATTVSAGSVSQYGLTAETYSVAASWNIFDGFATRGAKLSALASKRQYERLRQSYVDTTIDSITDMRRQIGFSSRAMSLSEAHHALIDSQVRQLNQELGLGYASQATIDSGVLNLYATEFNMAYARSDYLNHWTEFISLAGVDPALANLPSRYVR